MSNHKNEHTEHAPNPNKTLLPLLALANIPQAKPGAQKIIALKKRGGKVQGYKLSDGSIVDKNQAVSLAKQGEIAGVGVAVRSGKEYLKSFPDGSENDNLSSLPSFSD